MDHSEINQHSDVESSQATEADSEESATIVSGSSALLRRCLYTVIFLSGASALLYEVAWVRMMGLAVGSTTQAASCVIAAFLGGLALGGWLAGKLAVRAKVPYLVIYGALELGIAVTAPVVSYFLQGVPVTFASMTQTLPASSFWLTAERLTLASLLLVPPTMLMGATLPVVTEVLVKHYKRPAHYFSLLYGLNTLGAVFGSLAAVYLAFPFLGVGSSVLLAAAVNLGIAITVFVVSAISAKGQSATAGATAGDVAEADGAIKFISPTGTFELSQRWLCLVAGFLGFTALSYEVIWIRLIRVYLGSTTYAFTAMVSTFLLGLVAGSMIYNRHLARHPDFCSNLKDQLKMLAVSQAGAAVFSIIGLLLLPTLTVIQAACKAMNGGRDLPVEANLLLLPAITFCFLILPSTFIGLAFPLIGGLASSASKAVVRAVGSTYAANTVGCILGSLICGLVLIPTIGSQRAMELIVAINALCAIFIEVRIGQKERAWQIWSLAISLALVLLFLPDQYMERVYGYLTKGTLLAVKEDAIGRVLCIQFKTGKRLLVNGTMYSGDSAHGTRYMRMLAHLPILLNRHAKDVLIVCFGVGTTAGAVTTHNEVDHLDMCEISPAVLSCGDLFKATNFGVKHNPKVEWQLEDGRNYLLRTKKKYDVISFEPPPPIDAGVVNLYSKEFYELCKEHLNPGGILCQWAPMHLCTAGSWKAMVKTADVFNYVTLWLPSSLDPLIIASDQPVRLDLADVTKRINDSPLLKRSLTEVGLSDPYEIAATYLSGGADLKQDLSQVSPVTDDRPSLEFYLPSVGPHEFPSDLRTSDVHQILTGEAVDEKKLQAKSMVAHELREAAESVWKGNVDQAREHLAAALKAEPDNLYIQAANQHPEMK